MISHSIILSATMITWCFVQLTKITTIYHTWFKSVAGKMQPYLLTFLITSSHTQRLFLLGSSTTLQSLPVTAHAAVYLFSLTPATVPPFDTCILQHITVPGCDSALVAHSRLLPSLIARQAAISQQRLGITIEVHETESPTRPWANTAIHFNRDVPSGNQGKMIEEKGSDKLRWCETWVGIKTSWTAAIMWVYARPVVSVVGDWHGLICALLVGFLSCVVWLALLPYSQKVVGLIVLHPTLAKSSITDVGQIYLVISLFVLLPLIESLKMM